MPKTYLYKCIWIKKIVWNIPVIFFLMVAPVYGNGADEVVFDAIPLTLKVQWAGAIEIPAVIKNETAFLSVADLFTFLKIKNTVSPGHDSVSGFFLHPSDPYLIDKARNLISYKGKEFRVTDNDLIKTEANLFLNTKLLQDIFGLEFTFHFRSLSVSLKMNKNLPLFRQMQQEERRKMVQRLKGEQVADTSIGLKSPAIHLGAADWALYSTQTLNGPNNTRALLNLGGYLAGGETNIQINYYGNQPLTGRNLHYRWRHVNNDSKALRQITVGKLGTQSVSSIFSPVIGVQLSNSPTTYRRFFGTYTLTGRTEPDWTVELYVNNTLVDYTTADASGFFKFEVPLAYGSTRAELRYYGPWGEEKSDIRNIRIPFTFLPQNEFEYSISGGTPEDGPGRLFFRGSFNYGLTNRMTVGGGYEYLGAMPAGFSIPFLNTSFSITNNLLFTGEYAHGVRAKGLVSYRLPPNLMLDLSCTIYKKGQQAIYYNYLEERKASISIPLRLNKLTTYSRLSASQIILPRSTQFTQLDYVLTVSCKKLSSNLRTYAYIGTNRTATIYSDVSMGARLPGRIALTPTIRYNHTTNEMTGWKFRAEKPLFKNGYFTAAYEAYPGVNIKNLQVGLRYLFPAVQTSAYVNIANRTTSFSQSASGSLIIDPSTSYVEASISSKAGRGGITVSPFLDINCNGKRDDGEPKVDGVTVRATPAGRMKTYEKDTLIRIFNLEAYTSVYLELDGTGLENIAWQLKKKSYRVTVEPNLMKLVEVPVSVVAEVSGSIRIEGPDAHRPGRFKIDIFREGHSLANSIYSEDDGYYSYLGLPPGNYTVQVDSAQLVNQQLVSQPGSRDITILPDIDGVMMEEQDFTLKPLTAGTSKLPSDEIGPTATVPERNRLIRADGNEEINTKGMVEKETPNQSLTTDPATPEKIWFAVQVGAYSHPVELIPANFKGETFIQEIKTDGYYKYFIGNFTSYSQALQEKKRLRKKFHDAFIIAFKGNSPVAISEAVKF